MRLIKENSLIKFDRQFPIYNFFFPAQGREIGEVDMSNVLQEALGEIKSRALYFHIPFCETICNFCPFTRGKFSDRSVIDRYVDALLAEIRIKSQMVNLREIPIGAIFFGGGTPSLLNPDQIIMIGEEIRKTFDLTRMREFSFEIEVKSLTEEKVQAMREIGVTHPRFGLQTFSQKWRDIFDLTATLDQIDRATAMLIDKFPYQTFDILYGMSGTDESDLIADLQAAVNLGTSNVDIYPIDNIMTQVTLHRKIEDLKLQPTSAARKFGMGILVDEFMRNSGFMPHNGHGYVRAKTTSDVVSDKYSFVYHEHVYGYHDYDLLGFGTNAISSTHGYVITNTHSKKQYLDSMAQGNVPCVISQHPVSLDYARPVVLRLAYHGIVDKSKVHWEKISPEIINKLIQLKSEGLVIEDSESWRLTKLGWRWYVNIMYFLMPEDDQKVMNGIVVSKLKESGRRFSKIELLYPYIPISEQKN